MDSASSTSLGSSKGPPGPDPIAQRLFSSGERWGWEWRDINTLYVPFPIPPPKAPVPPALIPTPETGLNELAAQRRWRSQRWFWLVALLFIPALIGDIVGQGITWIGWIIGGLLLYLKNRTIKRAAKGVGPGGKKAWDEQWAKLSAEHEAARQAWERSAKEYHDREQQRLLGLPVWGAVRPILPTRRIDIYGGVPSGWEAIVTTLGGSLLGSGERLFVLDLSQADAASVLFLAASEAGVPSRVHVLPQGMEHVDVFADLDASGAKDILVEALHADEAEADRTARSLDDRILSQVCEMIAPTITFERISAGLRVLLRGEPPPSGNGGPLTADEWAGLADAFNEEYRSVIGSALVGLEAKLNPLRALGRLGPDPNASSTVAALEGLAISHEGGALLNELLVDVLVQTTIRRLGIDSVRERRAIFVIGADLLRRRHLERLDALAELRGTRIVYLFRHMRDDVLEVAGGDRVVAGVMRVGNPQEAERAAEFVGRSYRFKLTQQSHTVGTTDTSSWGETTTVGKSGAWMNWTQSFSTADQSGGALAETDQYADVETRMHDYELEPEVLRALPPTALVLVEFLPGAQHPHCRVADCNPVLATLSRVSLEPFEEDTRRIVAT